MSGAAAAMRGERPPQQWPMVPLGELIDLKYGKALKKDQRDETGSYIVYGSSGAVGKHSKTIIKDPTIIVGRKGSVGDITFAPRGGWTIDTAFYTLIKPGNDIDWRYLFYAMKSLQLKQLAITTSIPGLNRDDAYGTEIPLPPLPEQRRIAVILDKVEDIRRKQQSQLAAADQYLRALFLTLFGDPVTNPKGWEILSINEILSQSPNAIRTGPFGSQLKHSEFVDEGIPVLGIDNVVQNKFRWTKPRCLPVEKYQKFTRYRVYPGDIIITIMGTTGRVALAPNDIPECMSTKHLCVLSLDKDQAIPLFLWATLMFDQHVRGQAKTSSGGAIMEGWNMGIIKSLKVRVPPLTEQRRFVAAAKAVSALKSKLQHQLNETQTLALALETRAFNGEL